MIQAHLHVIDRISGQRTIHHGVLKTFLYRLDEFTRNHTTDDIINEFQSWLITLFKYAWSDLEYDVSKFTTTTSLFLVNFLVFNRLRKRFFVSDLRSTLIDLNFEFTLQTVDDNLQVQFTHTPKDGLTSFLICVNTECWIFLHQ